MSKGFQLRIPEPCKEGWDNMTPAEKGRFCSSCQKEVIDFTSMSDSQLIAFFKKPSTGSVCGRFNNIQLDHDFEIPRKRIPWLKYFFTVAVPTFFAVSKAKAQGQAEIFIKADTTSSLVSVKKMGRPDIAFDKRTILGKVVDEEGEPIAFATISCGNIRAKADGVGNFAIKPVSVQDSVSITASAAGHLDKTIAIVNADLLKQQNIVLKALQREMMEELVTIVGGISADYYPNTKIVSGTVTDEFGTPLPNTSIIVKKGKAGTITDKNGKFTLEIPRANKTLAVSLVGYDVKEIETKKLYHNSVIVLNKTELFFEGFVSVDFTKKKKEICTPVKETEAESPKETPLLTRVLSDTTFKSFKLYPNPVIQGTTVSIQWKKPEDGEFEIQLLDQKGQLINQQTKSATGKINSLQYSVPSVTPGSYFLILINRKSGKKITETIIVQ